MPQRSLATPGFVGNVLELPVSQIVIGAQRAAAFSFPCKAGNGRSVEQINIRQAVSVVIENRNAARGHPSTIFCQSLL